MAAKEMSVQKRAAILLAILALFVALDILPTPDGLTLEGKRSLALILCTTLIWISNVLPLGLVAMGALLLMPVLKLCTLPQAADKFCEPVFFFMVANYVVANGLAVTGLDRRITLLLAIASKGNAKKLLFIFMMGATILSMLLSDYLHYCCSAGAKSRLLGCSHRFYGISGLLNSIRRNSTGLLWISIF